jgi:hypothetical protein
MGYEGWPLIFACAEPGYPVAKAGAVVVVAVGQDYGSGGRDVFGHRLGIGDEDAGIAGVEDQADLVILDKQGESGFRQIVLVYHGGVFIKNSEAHGRLLAYLAAYSLLPVFSLRHCPCHTHAIRHDIRGIPGPVSFIEEDDVFRPGYHFDAAARGSTAGLVGSLAPYFFYFCRGQGGDGFGCVVYHDNAALVEAAFQACYAPGQQGVVRLHGRKGSFIDMDDTLGPGILYPAPAVGKARGRIEEGAYGLARQSPGYGCWFPAMGNDNPAAGVPGYSYGDEFGLHAPGGEFGAFSSG